MPCVTSLFFRNSSHKREYASKKMTINITEFAELRRDSAPWSLLPVLSYSAATAPAPAVSPVSRT